jgi:hypothetical protein
LEDRDEQYDIGIIRCDKLVRIDTFVDVFEFVNNDVDGAPSWFIVQFLVKVRGEVERVLPSCLAVYGGSTVGMTEIVLEMLYMILGIS